MAINMPSASKTLPKQDSNSATKSATSGLSAAELDCLISTLPSLTFLCGAVTVVSSRQSPFQLT